MLHDATLPVAGFRLDPGRRALAKQCVVEVRAVREWRAGVGDEDVVAAEVCGDLRRDLLRRPLTWLAILATGLLLLQDVPQGVLDGDAAFPVVLRDAAADDQVTVFSVDVPKCQAGQLVLPHSRDEVGVPDVAVGLRTAVQKALHLVVRQRSAFLGVVVA